MENKELVREWLTFAQMDFLTAKHLYDSMYPKPLEIICYHCQQAIEKLLKGILISHGVAIKKTHDLGLLAEMLQEYVEVEPQYLEMCDDLTPYGVKIRYPQELSIEEFHVKKAIAETQELYDWLKGLYDDNDEMQLESQKDESDGSSDAETEKA